MATKWPGSIRILPDLSLTVINWLAPRIRNLYLRILGSDFVGDLYGSGTLFFFQDSHFTLEALCTAGSVGRVGGVEGPHPH
jgi:hypothetical protein